MSQVIVMMQSAPECITSNIKPFGVLRQRHRQAAKRYHTVVAAIARLLKPSGPSTVIRFIVSVVINAFQLVCGRGLWSHVGKKVFKGLLPSSTNFYPAFGISVIFTPWPKTSGYHRLVRRIFVWIAAPAGFVSFASAISSEAAPKVATLNRLNDSTYTTTQPKRPTLPTGSVIPIEPNHRPMVKRAARNIYQLISGRHKIKRTTFIVTRLGN